MLRLFYFFHLQGGPDERGDALGVIGPDRLAQIVGEVAHPMIDEHYIQFIILETDRGYQKKDLKPGEEPKAVFALADGEKAVAAYEYCNLHGLWKADIK